MVLSSMNQFEYLLQLFLFGIIIYWDEVEQYLDLYFLSDVQYFLTYFAFFYLTVIPEIHLSLDCTARVVFSSVNAHYLKHLSCDN